MWQCLVFHTQMLGVWKTEQTIESCRSGCSSIIPRKNLQTSLCFKWQIELTVAYLKTSVHCLVYVLFHCSCYAFSFSVQQSVLLFNSHPNQSLSLKTNINSTHCKCIVSLGASCLWTSSCHSQFWNDIWILSCAVTSTDRKYI